MAPGGPASGNFEEEAPEMFDAPLSRTSAHWRPRPKSVIITLAVGAAVLLVLAGLGLMQRRAEFSELRRLTAEQSLPTVQSMTVKPGPASETLVLPGGTQALIEAPLYARTNGYVKAWYADIGTAVKKGQILAEIDSPEVDDQTRQAEADVATATANAHLAQTTVQRWLALLRTDSVSKQDVDEKIADTAAKDAVMESAKANLARLRQLKAFSRIVAPFDGIITARHTDVGALIAGGGAGLELFHLADTSKLRVYVQVPQTYSASVRTGLTAQLQFPQYPGQAFPAVVAHSADAIDPVSRTLLVELQIDNHSHKFLPGAYVQVHFDLPEASAIIRVPANSLIFRSDGVHLARVDANGQVTLPTVTLGRDFGTEVEVLTGLAVDDTILLNPPESLTVGQAVRLAGGGHH
jgi:RND family efflux transporter MFP subunit